MFASLLLALLASQGITYDATYDCGPGYATFTVRECAGAVCDVSYANPGQATRRVRLNRSQIATAITRGCHPAKSAQAYRDEAVRYEARANALLHPHPAAPVAPAARIARVAPAGGGLVLGKYECYTYSGGELESAMALNFTLFGGGGFADASGHRGTYRYAGGMVTFAGTGLGGHRAKYTPGVPHSNNPPHITFLQSNGDEGDSCDGVG